MSLSVYFCICSCQYCYHIKQKYYIFFPPRAFRDMESAEKVFAAAATPRGTGWRAHEAVEANTLPESPPPLNAFAVSISASSAPHFKEHPPKIFSRTRPWLHSCIFRCLSRHLPGASPRPQNFSARTAHAPPLRPARSSGRML